MAYFDSEQKEKIKHAIEEAEHLTSGEIRVCVEKVCKIHPIPRAAYFFKKLKMDNTLHRNGVLIYLAHENRKFAIIGDSGIHQVSGDHFWESVKETMQVHFKSGNILEGVLEAIKITGIKLKEFFPFEEDKPNELPDDVVDQG